VITVYGADWCEDTQRSLRHLRRLGVPHHYLNIDEDLDALERAKALNGGKRRTPTIDLGFGGAPLVEDASVRSDPTTLVNLEVGRRIGRRFSVSLAACNVFDSDDNDITYFYESRLPGESAPVADRHVHPVEPRTLRVTLETRW